MVNERKLLLIGILAIIFAGSVYLINMPSLGAVIFNALFYVGTLLLIMLLYLGISLAFQYASQKGHPIKLLGHIFWKTLKPEEAKKIGIGKAMAYQMLQLRFDMMLPLFTLYFFMLILFFPQLQSSVVSASSTVSYPILAIILILYSVAYLIYSMLSAYMLYLKADALQVSEDEIRNIVMSIYD
jgi:hypothetical protein